LNAVNFHEVRRTANRVRAIPLEAVLALTGAVRDQHDREKWHTAGGVLSVTGAKFFNWTQAVGGGGAIDLVIHLECVGFKAAVEWLAQRFPESEPSPRAVQPPPHVGHLQLPHRDSGKLPIVRRYLVHQRSLAPSLIDALLDAGRIYADDRGNAVFVMLGDQERPVGAEIRGTTSRPWKGLAPGSKKDLGYFSVSAPGDNTIVLCESAIDALSCFTLHPGTLCISTAGARPNPRWLAPLLRSVRQVVCCGFDADPIGDDMASAMLELHPQVHRLRPQLHDWNDVVKAQSR
jgi:hypothetical protein